jgi:Alpha/beta hydrolase domain
MLATLSFVVGHQTACGEITRIEIQKETAAVDGKAFGATGAYRILTGLAHGELDPADRHNAIINDLPLAPTNERGKVEYSMTFTLALPEDLKQANGLLFYGVPNRGNRTSPGAFGVAGETGDEFLMKRGYIILQGGWQGDLAPRAGTETISVPIAQNRDGSSVTGRVLVRWSDVAAGTKSQALFHHAANLDSAHAVLLRQATWDGATVPIPSTDWAFSDCSQTAFPGVVDEAKVSLKAGFDPGAIYTLSYTAKDPPVLGIGFAATRDLVSYFRYAGAEAGNPLAGAVHHAIALGISQCGNFVRSFLNLGFNLDVKDRLVWDGANAHIAARQLPINFRFARPGGAAELYEPGSEGVLWWSAYEDTARQQPAAGLLDRCRATHSCPKIFETFGSAEFWGLRMSPNLVGTDARRDIELPENVRRYYFPGTAHGGGRGGFSASHAVASGELALAENPNPQAETMRALFLALSEWVVRDVRPPESSYPRLDRGELVSPDRLSMGYPVIPGKPLPDGLLNPFFHYDFGPGFVARDLSGVITRQPPAIRQILPMLVPRVDADGNEVGGIPSVQHQVPLGTYTGWNAAQRGPRQGHRSGFAAGFIPFAHDEDERRAGGDPRKSLVERYRDHAGFVEEVRKAAARTRAQRFLLPEDGARLIQQAEESDVLQ